MFHAPFLIVKITIIYNDGYIERNLLFIVLSYAIFTYNEDLFIGPKIELYFYNWLIPTVIAF